MANEEHLKILQQGIAAWNLWRRQNLELRPDLRHTSLAKTDLSGGNFNSVNLSGSNLDEVNLEKAKLRGAKLDGSSLYKAILTNADLHLASFRDTNLREANLRKANLHKVHFQRVDLKNTDFSMSHVSETVFTSIDLSEAKGLDTVKHFGPSNIGIDTLYKSGGKIPPDFLRGCGVPDDFIAFIPSHFGVQQAIQFYSCFISYSSRDETFAQRLHSRMRDEHLRVWFAPEDIKGGEKIHEQIEQAIQLHDRLLLVLSENSMESEWVITEIRNARRVEIEQKRRKLFPIRLVDFEMIKKWKCFDSATGKDLAAEVQEYFIPDFSKWKDHDAFEAAFNRLMRDLKAEEAKQHDA